jgi:hypothetical protein
MQFGAQCQSNKATNPHEKQHDSPNCIWTAMKRRFTLFFQYNSVFRQDSEAPVSTVLIHMLCFTLILATTLQHSVNDCRSVVKIRREMAYVSTEEQKRRSKCIYRSVACNASLSQPFPSTTIQPFDATV